MLHNKDFFFRMARRGLPLIIGILAVLMYRMYTTAEVEALLQQIPSYPYEQQNTTRYVNDIKDTVDNVCPPVSRTTYRITQFNTTDLPEQVIQFYRVALFKNGPYAIVNWSLNAPGQPGAFNAETFKREVRRDQNSQPWPTAFGVGVIVRAEKRSYDTAVTLSEFRYQQAVANMICDTL